MNPPCPERAALEQAVAVLGDEHAARPEPFRWFSEKVDACLALAGEAALDALRKLIDEAEADKLAGYGPPQSDLTVARRKWLDLYSEIYRRVA
mgnify:CR=1 FL=1